MVPQTRPPTPPPATVHLHLSLQQVRPGRTAHYYTGVVRPERIAISLRLQALPPQHVLHDMPVPQAGTQ
jgi:hypothetical protein